MRIAVPGGAPAPRPPHPPLPTGSSVTTAAGGRATLDNGDQHIVVGPNSRLTVQPDQGGFTRIAQDLGAAMFKVDKKAAPHFRVDTPLLAAIVKGTTFTVMVEGASDAVSVAEGLVEVRSNQNAAFGADVAAGATGSVLRDAPGAVQVVTPASAPAGPALPPVAIVPIDYKAASGGLIDIAPAVAENTAAQAAVARGEAASNNAVGATLQDSPAAAPGGSAAVVASQIAGLEAGQRETPAQLALAATVTNGNNGLANGVSGNGNGAGNNGNGNGNGGSAVVAPVVVAVADTTSGLLNTVTGNGNSGNGDSGNGNSGNGNNSNGNGNGGSAGAIVAVVANTTGSLLDAVAGNNGNGNSGNGNSGNGNSGNGNSGNGNGGSSAGLIPTVVTTVTDTTGGLLGAVAGDSGNSGNGNGNNGNANGVSGNGNGNGNSGNGNGNGGAVTTVVAVVTDTTGGLVGSLTGNGNSGNGNSGNGNSGNGNSGNGASGNGNSGSSGSGSGLVSGLVGGLLGK